MHKENIYESSIAKALETVESLKRFDKDEKPKEDGRVKAVVRTKLQEAYLWAGQIYNPKFTEEKEKNE